VPFQNRFKLSHYLKLRAVFDLEGDFVAGMGLGENGGTIERLRDRDFWGLVGRLLVDL
jgi:hypothetical protein